MIRLVVEYELDLTKQLKQARVRYQRQEKGRTVDSIAAKLETDRVNLYRIENGVNPIKPWQLLKLQELYGVKLVELNIEDAVTLEVIKDDKSA